jgi:putative transposase
MSGSYDFVEDHTHDGRNYRMLNVLDELTHEVWRSASPATVIDVLSDLFILRRPAHIRSDNGPEFMVKAVQAAYPIGSAAARPKREKSGRPRLDSAESI